MSRAKNLQQALEHLATPLRVTPEVGERLRSLLSTLDASDEPDKTLATLLRTALTYAGSPQAREAVQGLHAALQTQQGRKAAGLPPRKRSKGYDTSRITLDRIPAGVAFRLAAQQIERAQALEELHAYLGSEADDRTVERYLDELLPRVQGVAAMLKKD